MEALAPALGVVDGLAPYGIGRNSAGCGTSSSSPRELSRDP